MDSKIIHYLFSIPVLASTGIASIWNRFFPSSQPAPQTTWSRKQSLVSLNTDPPIICCDPNNPDHWPASTTITATWEQVDFHGDGTTKPASFIWPPVGVILEKHDPDKATEFIDNVIIANPSGKGVAELKAVPVTKDTKVRVKALFNGEIKDVTVTVKAM